MTSPVGLVMQNDFFFFRSSFFFIFVYKDVIYFASVAHSVKPSPSQRGSSSEPLLSRRFAKTVQAYHEKPWWFLTLRYMNSRLCCCLKTGHVIISELSFRAYHFFFFIHRSLKHELEQNVTWCRVMSFLMWSELKRLFECVWKRDSFFVLWFLLVCVSVWPCGIITANVALLTLYLDVKQQQQQKPLSFSQEWSYDVF